MKALKVLSLFDGISCGMVALERANIPVERYVAYEIDEDAIRVSQNNYPQIEHKGDIKNANFEDYAEFDLVIAGFPCQDLSINQKNRKGLNGERSGLFWYLVDALKTINPTYFLVENNYKMPKEDEETISKILGVRPSLIDSAFFSAQSRKRLYWTNFPVGVEPLNKKLCVKDVLCSNVEESNLIKEVVFNGNINKTENKYKPIRVGTIGKGGQGERVYSIYGKSVTISANGGGRGAKTGLYLIDDCVRKLTPIETERLQTLPDNYTSCIKSNGKRIGLCGNGWTVDVIKFIFEYMKNYQPLYCKYDSNLCCCYPVDDCKNCPAHPQSTDRYWGMTKGVIQ